MNMNEILKDGLYDLVADITCGGMIVNGEVTDGAYENGKLLAFEDLLEIVNSNDSKRFFDIEMRDDEYGSRTIRALCRHWTKNQLYVFGAKFNNGMMARMFKIIKEIVTEMEILSDKNEQDLKTIKDEHNVICKDVMQYALYVERCMMVALEEN